MVSGQHQRSRHWDDGPLYGPWIGSIQSDLELTQWRTNMLELTLIVSKHVSQTIDEGLVHLDCRVVYQIADIVQEALTFICKVQARLSGELPTIECTLGWVQFNRYCRVRHPKGLSGHHGPAALSFLRLLSVARNSVKQLFPPNHPLEEVRPIDIPAFRIDLSWLIIDRESDCYSGIESHFQLIGGHHNLRSIVRTRAGHHCSILRGHCSTGIYY